MGRRKAFIFQSCAMTWKVVVLRRVNGLLPACHPLMKLKGLWIWLPRKMSGCPDVPIICVPSTRGISPGGNEVGMVGVEIGVERGVGVIVFTLGVDMKCCTMKPAATTIVITASMLTVPRKIWSRFIYFLSAFQDAGKRQNTFKWTWAYSWRMLPSRAWEDQIAQMDIKLFHQ